MARQSNSGLAAAGSIFAATMLLVIGVFQGIMGIVAITRNEFYVVVRNYVFNMNTTGWGWIHVVLGALLLITGIFLYLDAGWAAAAGIVLAALSAVNSFFFMPYYPLWSIVVIAADAFVIWSLATMLSGRGEVDRPSGRQAGGEHWQHADRQPERQAERQAPGADMHAAEQRARHTAPRAPGDDS